MRPAIDEDVSTIPLAEPCLVKAISLMTNVVEMACEHESDLDLIRLMNYLDLYRAYLTHAIASAPAQGILLANTCIPVAYPREMNGYVSFEQFVGDTKLLQFAALAATHESGDTVATPLPLKYSASLSDLAL